MNHASRSNQQGFTIIELTLAMTFIAALLLAIALTIIQIGAVYNRGMLLKEVNQVSRSVADDLRRTLPGSRSLDIATDYKSFPGIGGRLCTGTVSYIWNVGKSQSTNQTNVMKYAVGSSKAGTPVRLVKVADSTKSYCAVDFLGRLTKLEIPASEQGELRELIIAGERELAVQRFGVDSGVTAVNTVSGQRLYSISFDIGTNDQGALEAGPSGEMTECKDPGKPGADTLYCAVRSFTVVVRT